MGEYILQFFARHCKIKISNLLFQKPSYFAVKPNTVCIVVIIRIIFVIFSLTACYVALEFTLSTLVTLAANSYSRNRT